MVSGAPRFVIDKRIFLENAMRFSAYCHESGLRPRVHLKSIKAMALARLLATEVAIESFAVARAEEAFALSKIGSFDLFWAYPFAGTERLAVLRQLCTLHRMSVMVDSVWQANQLKTAAQDLHQLSVWLELESGLKRTGVNCGDELSELIAELCSASRVSIRGLSLYFGQYWDPARSSSFESEIPMHISLIHAAKRQLSEAGITQVEISAAASPVLYKLNRLHDLTELRVGSALLGDFSQVLNFEMSLESVAS